MSRLSWSIRRELWEHRSIFVAPMTAAALFLGGFFLALGGLPGRMRAALALGPAAQREAIEQPYVLAAILVMVIAPIVAVVYSLDALYGERRDRSILLWKSLPVSDVTTVCAKAAIPIIVIPVITLAVTTATQLCMLLASSAVLTARGLSSTLLWSYVPLFGTALTNIGHLVVFHGLWYAPFFGWLLLVSAWANRAPIVWATLPPIAIALVERVTFNTSHFTAWLQHRFLETPDGVSGSAGMTMDMLAPHAISHLLIRQGMWGGLAVTAILLWGAVALRRSRGPI